MGRALTRWVHAAAAVVGRGHEAAGEECQDRVGVVVQDRVVAAALSDGAGSCACAAAGAELAVVASLAAVVDGYDLVVREPAAAARLVLDAVRDAAGTRARAEGRALRDFGATLLLVAAGRGRFFALHIGDGVIAVERRGRVRLLSQHDRGEHANETVLVTSSDAAERMRVHSGGLHGVAGLALMSDGSAESLFDRRRGVLAPALTTLWRWQELHPAERVQSALAANLGDVLRDRTADDCSMIALRRVRPSAQ